MTAADVRASLSSLEAMFHQEVQLDRRAAAETAFALAVRYRSEDIDGVRQFGTAGGWARTAADLLDQLPADTPEQVASPRRAVGGVEIPELPHSGVVRHRLADVLIFCEVEDER
ncbi:hypothetical protein ACWDKQ_09895 [Saccharopolyspora sp. NPDC000995]